MSTTINIHPSIITTLDHFCHIKKVPNILFHGPPGSGKHYLINHLLSQIYPDTKLDSNMIMMVNCAQCKSIKFIRDELKFFAKSNINASNGSLFKSVVLLNGDKLTLEAQSALRRCIELYSHTTRIFMSVHDKHRLLQPILSRFCEILVPEPDINGVKVNLYAFNLTNRINTQYAHIKQLKWLKTELENNITLINKGINKKNNSCKHYPTWLITFSNKLYEKGYSAIDILEVFENNCELFNLSDEKLCNLGIMFSQCRQDIRSEQLLIASILNAANNPP